MDMLEMIAPLCRTVDNNLCRPSAVALSTSERLVKRTVDKIGIPEVPCKARAV
jgi:hypothetical protein